MTKYQTRKASRRLQKGASLLEGIAYLGIAAIVVIGAIALLNTAFSSANSNELNSELSAIQTASRKLFMTTQGNYGATDFTATLIAAKGFPQTLTTDATNGTVADAWGGFVTVAPVATDNTKFTITYTKVPPDICVNALTSTTTGWLTVTGPGNGVAVAPPISPGDAQAACGTAAGDVVWTSS